MLSDEEVKQTYKDVVSWLADMMMTFQAGVYDPKAITPGVELEQRPALLNAVLVIIALDYAETFLPDQYAMYEQSLLPDQQHANEVPDAD